MQAFGRQDHQVEIVKCGSVRLPKGSFTRDNRSFNCCNLKSPLKHELLMQAKRVLLEKHPKAKIIDPEPGKCHNGWTRGCNNTSYDFRLGARRIEVKSARMAWSSTERYWNALVSLAEATHWRHVCIHLL